MSSDDEVKRQAYLDFLNWVLKSIGKDPISSFDEFVDIKRDELKKIDIAETEKEWIDILFGPFTKESLYFHHRRARKLYVLALIKYCTRQFDDITFHAKSHKVTINHYTHLNILYSLTVSQELYD